MENKLQSMVDFVLDCHEKCISTNGRTYNYAKFLKRPLEIWMFVPCDENGNVLQEPKAEDYFNVNIEAKKFTKEDSEGLNKHYSALMFYEKAKERVLFEGFELIEISKNLRIIKNEKLDCQVFANQHENHYYKCLGFKTIEDLVRYNLTLTNNALKIWE